MIDKFNSFSMVESLNNLHFTTAPGDFFEKKEFRSAVEWPVADKLGELTGVNFSPDVEAERFVVNGKRVFCFHFVANTPSLAWQAYMKFESRDGMRMSYETATNKLRIFVSEDVLNEIFGYEAKSVEEVDDELGDGVGDVHEEVLDAMVAKL